MPRYLKNLILLTLATAVVIGGGWYWYSSAKRAQAAVNVPQTAAAISDIVNAMGDVADINLSNFNSLDQISSLFDVIGGNNQTLGQMSDWLGTFGQMGGGVEDLLDGNFRSIGDVVTGLGQITDLGGATDVLNSLGGLGANVDDILSGGLNFNNASDLISSLSQMTNSGSFGDLLDVFGNNGGSYEDLILYASENGADIGAILETGSVTMTDLAPLVGQGGGILGSSGSSSGVGTKVGQTSQEAQQSLNQDRKQDEKECKAETGGGLLGGLTGGGGGGLLDGLNVGSLLDGGLGNVLSGSGLGLDQVSQIPGVSNAISQIPGAGGALGGLTGSSYVPVQEQDGDLIDLTEDTNELTSEIKDLQVQICMHLKTIKRVQLNIEDKEFIGDVRAREEAAKRLNDVQKETLNYLTTGNTKTDGSAGSFTPTVQEHVTDKVENAAKIVATQAKNSGSAFAPKLATFLEQEKKQSTFENRVASDIAENQFKEFADPVKSRELNYKSWTRMFLAVSDPQNNPSGSALMALEESYAAKAKAGAGAIVDIIAGGGFVSKTECVEEDEDGNCTKEKIITAGSINQAAGEKSVLLDVEQTLLADEVSDINDDSAPGIGELETFKPSSDSSANSGSPGGGAGEGSGPGGNFELSDLADLFTNGDLSALFDLFGSDSSGNGGNLGGFSLSDILNYLNGGGNIGDLDLPPIVNFKLTGPTLEQIYEGRPNVATISWKAQNADSCTVRNDWLSSSLIPNRAEAVKELGDNLETSGSLITYLPLTFDVRLERTRDSQTAIIGYATTTSAALTQQVTSITLNNNEVVAGDRFSLVAKVGLSDEARVTIETNMASASTVNNLLGAALNQLSKTSATGKEFGKYRVTFTANESGTGFITVTADPIYSIRCTSGGRNTDRTVTVSRGS